MKTTCEFCLFAKKENGKQVGCELNRLEIFKKKELIDDRYWLIDGYCNTCRNDIWKNNKWPNEVVPLEKLIETVHKEESPTYEFLVTYDNEDVCVEQVKKILALDVKISQILILTSRTDFQVFYTELLAKVQSDVIKVMFVYDAKTEEEKFLEVLRLQQKQKTHYRVMLHDESIIDKKTFDYLDKKWQSLKYIPISMANDLFIFASEHTDKIINIIVSPEPDDESNNSNNKL